MRPTSGKVNRFRVRAGRQASTDDYGNTGAFEVPAPQHDGTILRVIASEGGGWDHVSVSVKDRCPTWAEMCFIKDLFFLETEWAMQLHPPRELHINYHEYTLHLWRPHDPAWRKALQAVGRDDAPELPTPGPIPIPPRNFV